LNHLSVPSYCHYSFLLLFSFFNVTSSTEIYTLSLHDALPILLVSTFGRLNYDFKDRYLLEANFRYDGTSRFMANNRWAVFPSFSDRKSTRLNSSHVKISYAVFCLKKKNKSIRSSSVPLLLHLP